MISKSMAARLMKVRALYVRDGRRCFYCGRMMLSIEDIERAPSRSVEAINYPTFDHVVPLSRGGANTLNNLVIACRECNVRKGSSHTKAVPSNIDASSSTECPDCRRTKADRACESCNSRGVLTAEMAVWHLERARSRIASLQEDKRLARREVERLRAIIENRDGVGAANRGLHERVVRQEKTIKQMAQRISELGGGRTPLKVVS